MPVVNSVQEEQRAEYELYEKLHRLPAPLHPNTNGNPRNCAVTTLLNAASASGSSSLKWSETSRGEDHIPFWSVSVSVDGIEYGHAEQRRKVDAKKIAAEQALRRLKEENSPILQGTVKYFPIFTDYLKANDLDRCASYNCTSAGPDHARRWNCVLSIDGFALGIGAGQKKQSAMEEAARDAAINWPRSSESSS